MLTHSDIRTAYEDACRQEIEAFKPGNVHVFAEGHDMTVGQFLTSANVSSEPLTDPKLSLGTRIFEAVRATRNAVGTNTNLGIILLCAPLMLAAETNTGDLRSNLDEALRAMDLEDTAAVFEAIVLASPGGLGSSSQHDVREKPTVHLLEAMREASARDSIARQYVTSYQDIFERGLPALEAATARGESAMWPTVFAYMEFLSTFPDSHVLRKHGAEIAEEVRQEAAIVRATIGRNGDREDRIRILAAFDGRLKQRGINPGTSADLTVACLLVHNLRLRLA
ncbi:triphosphoribosyl-dephospho-CoA synthase [Mesorhizobium sp. CGMCC 1.15528]|uniref:Triphosphoribosyl-dephospho-CoA synthase n=1 Tax=Mesorhizobium zhangyense TaxID=1776730 RepID=A0A7C9V6V1_9HYPH|nr:triphosphoribosyl-dephospho-CoA synthase [Mesorhizobium zhangyense]NGN41283.1 triphosphoribosyl-dephospho-CoA synthase [Mesorhizobium zhangyense]